MDREAFLDPDHLQKDTLLSQNFVLNLILSFPSNLSKYVDKKRYIYVTSLLESDEVSKPVSRFMFKVYKTPIQNTVLFYGITMTSISREYGTAMLLTQIPKRPVRSRQRYYPQSTPRYS
jgi:hypothetical protein